MLKNLKRVATAGALAGCMAMAVVATGGGDAVAGASGSGPGVTASTKTITLGVLTPLTGEASLIGKPLTTGEKTYFDWLNAHGGVGGGWKVKLDIEDDAYTPTQAVSKFNTEVTHVLFIVQSLGSPTTKAIEAEAASDKVLLSTAAQDSAFVNHKINLVQGTPYAVTVANALYYVTHTLHKTKAKMAIVYNNTAYGQDGLKGYEAAKKAYHFTTVSQQTATATETNFTSQATALKASGAQYVVTTVLPTEAPILIAEAASLTYHPQWILQGPAWSEYVLSSNGTTTGKPTPYTTSLNGAWVMGYVAPWGDTSIPGMKQLLTATAKYDKTQIPDAYYEYGFAEAWIAATLLKKVVKSGHITRTEVLKAKESLGTVSTGGLLPTATYTSKNGPASRETDLAKVTKNDPKQGYLKLFKGFFQTSVGNKMTFTSSGTT